MESYTLNITQHVTNVLHQSNKDIESKLTKTSNKSFLFFFFLIADNNLNSFQLPSFPFSLGATEVLFPRTASQMS